MLPIDKVPFALTLRDSKQCRQLKYNKFRQDSDCSFSRFNGSPEPQNLSKKNTLTAHSPHKRSLQESGNLDFMINRKSQNHSKLASQFSISGSKAKRSHGKFHKDRRYQSKHRSKLGYAKSRKKRSQKTGLQRRTLDTSAASLLSKNSKEAIKNDTGVTFFDNSRSLSARKMSINGLSRPTIAAFKASAGKSRLPDDKKFHQHLAKKLKNRFHLANHFNRISIQKNPTKKKLLNKPTKQAPSEPQTAYLKKKRPPRDFKKKYNFMLPDRSVGYRKTLKASRNNQKSRVCGSFTQQSEILKKFSMKIFKTKKNSPRPNRIIQQQDALSSKSKAAFKTYSSQDTIRRSGYRKWKLTSNGEDVKVSECWGLLDGPLSPGYSLDRASGSKSKRFKNIKLGFMHLEKNFYLRKFFGFVQLKFHYISKFARKKANLKKIRIQARPLPQNGDKKGSVILASNTTLGVPGEAREQKGRNRVHYLATKCSSVDRLKLSSRNHLRIGGSSLRPLTSDYDDDQTYSLRRCDLEYLIKGPLIKIMVKKLKNVEKVGFLKLKINHKFNPKKRTKSLSTNRMLVLALSINQIAKSRYKKAFRNIFTKSNFELNSLCQKLLAVNVTTTTIQGGGQQQNMTPMLSKNDKDSSISFPSLFSMASCKKNLAGAFGSMNGYKDKGLATQNMSTYNDSSEFRIQIQEAGDLKEKAGDSGLACYRSVDPRIHSGDRIHDMSAAHAESEEIQVLEFCAAGDVGMTFRKQERLHYDKAESFLKGLRLLGELADRRMFKHFR